MIHTSTYTSPLGLLTLAAEEGTLVGLWFEGQKYFGSAFNLTSAKAETSEPEHNKLNLVSTELIECEPADIVSSKDFEILARALDWLDCYFSDGRPSLAGLPLAPQGTTYQRSVWSLLCEIPFGQLISYGELARRLGNGTSPRAVGYAVSRNPISLIIPCHRVVGFDGRLTGYAGGLERKRWLLKHEGAI